MPNYIDQDHFEGKLAEALKTTKEAVHFEVDRIRSEKTNITEKTNKEPVSNLKSSGGEVKQNESVLTYLVGALSLFPESAQAAISIKLVDITGKQIEALRESVPTAALAEVLFRTESFLDKNPRKVFEEEYIYKLSKYRELVIRTDLKEAREALHEAEAAGASEVEAALMGKVAMLQQALQVAPYTIDLIKGK